MIHDISIAVNVETPEWPGDTPFSCRWTWEIENGESVNVSAITQSPHVGTHADAPVHVRDGWTGIDQLPLEPFIGDAMVIDVGDATGDIDVGDLDYDPARDGARLLLRTRRGIAFGSFPEAWPSLSETAARTLVARGMQLLGVDAPSVDARRSTTLPVHHALFSGGACVLENLDLRAVVPGRYELIAFPLRLQGLDAAPVRAVLRALPVGA